jgi:glycosyltransferase involved in cell wall biosynthesis
MTQAYKVLLLVENGSVPMDNRVWAEAITLREQGFQVSIIGPKGTKLDREPYSYLHGIHIYRYRLPASTGTYTAYLLEYGIALVMTFLLSLKVLFRQGFDVIHAANPPDTLFIIGLFYRLLGKKYVFDQHDLSPEIFQVKFKRRMKPLYKLLLVCERCSYRTANLVITTNTTIKRFAIERGHVPADKIFVIYNGVDLNRIRRVEPEPALKRGRPFLLAFVGAMEVQDGVEHILYALHELVHKRGHQDVSLVLMGDGDHAPTLHALAHQLHLDEYIHFNGWTNAENISRYLSAADIALIPESQNGLNEYCTLGKTFDYMATGKPAVAFDLCETRILAQDAMLYAAPNDIEDFTDKIEMLLNDGPLRSRMGAIGRKRIEEAFSWDHTKMELVRAYETLLPKSL